MTTNQTHAIVIGGSMAGLLAARVLSDHFDRVTLIERDHYPDQPDFRSGVPQSRHIHILLVSGMRILERLFPGFDAELEAAGAGRVLWGTSDIHTRLSAGWMPLFESDLVTRSASRALLDWLVHKRLVDAGKVAFVENCQANGLVATPDGTRITGVRLQARSGAREEQTLLADLVVDASGRASNTPEWLEALGYPAVEETEVNSFLGYATRWYKLPKDSPYPWKIMLIQSVPPTNPRGGGIFLVEGARMLVTLAGAVRDYPPTDEAGFMEFARTLPSRELYEVINDAEPISPIYGYQRTANRLHRYERLGRWPVGFVVMGDAVCAFNPIYGQGMSVAAMGAMALDENLRRANGDWSELGPRFQKAQAKVVRAPWMLATGEDFRFPGTQGQRGGFVMRLMHGYTDRLFLLMPRNPVIISAFAQVQNLLQPPGSLMKPSIVWRVLRQAITGQGKAPSLPRSTQEVQAVR